MIDARITQMASNEVEMAEEMEAEASLQDTSPIPAFTSSPAQDRSSKSLAEMALADYNDAARISLRREYKYVKDKCVCMFLDVHTNTQWFHLNFIAKPDLETKDFTFFAEIKLVDGIEYYVTKCEIIGPTDQVSPSLRGCDFCEISQYRNEIAHPIGAVITRAEFILP